LARRINSLTSSTLPELHQRHCRHLAYWELRAEEVMDRVFAVVTPAEGTAAIPAVEPAMAPAAEITTAATSPWRQRRWWFVLGGLCLLSSSAAITAGLLWRGWMQARDELQHQRQLQLIERLKPASEPAPAPAPMPPLRVEIPTVIPPAVTLDPAGERPGSTAANSAVVPELLGVVKVPGRSGSAIFSTGGNSLSTGVGEPIGSSGWILEQVQADRVVIRQGSDTLQLSLGR